MVVFFVQLHFTTRVRYGFLSVQLNYTIRQPIIVSNRGALPELVEDGENGYIFPFDSPDALTHLLSGLDKEKLADMGRKAEKIFQKKYQMERMIEESIRLYEGKDKK